MHFYQKNIGDFNNATRHLTRVERSLFSDAIELYYDTEKPLTSDINKLNRLLLAHSQEEKDALLAVLAEFFTLTDEGYFNKRCNEEILKYQAYMESKSKAGKASAEQRAKQKATGVEQVLNTTPTKQNQEPLTINNNKNIRGSRLPSDWIAPQEYIDFCQTERPDLDANFIAEGFKDYWIGVVGAKGVKADWLATWRNWVRRQEVSKSKFKNKSSIMSDGQFDDWLNSSGKVVQIG